MKNIKKFFILLTVIIFSQVLFAVDETEYYAVIKNRDFSKIKLKDINDVEYSFKNRSKKIYLKLWTSSCHTCIKGLPDLEKLIKEKNNFEIVTVVFPKEGFEKNSKDFKKWYSSLPYKNIKVLIDEESEILNYVKPFYYPTILFLDKNAKIKGTVSGKINNESIKKIINLM